MESAPDAIVIVDAAGRIAFVNGQTETLFGYRRDELIDRSIESLTPERLRTNHVAHRQGYAIEPRTRPMGVGLELHGRRKDGSEFPVEISLSPVDVDGKTYTVSAIRDITERHGFQQELQKKNVELKRSNEAKDRFLASMSHELRTPLNAIIGFTGTLLMRLPGPLTDDQERQLRIVQSSARHLLSLISDILDLGKIESGKVEAFYERVPVGAVVAEVADSLRSLAEEKRITLTTPAFDSQPEIVVETDRRALHQILLNLAGNAIKFTDRGSVRIDVSALGGAERRVALSVCDTGPGIRKEDRMRLFRAFEQLDSSSTRRFDGAGLGLYLSDRLATLIGGSLSVESTYGEGSTFTLTLPADPR